MDQQTEAEVIERLPAETYYEVMRKLRACLPPAEMETAAARAVRERAVMEQVVRLVPASAIEAELAAKSVAAAEYGFDCQRLALLHRDDPKRENQLLAQAARMGRESRGYLASLQRVQALRVKREATEAGAYRADAMEEYARGLMLRALEQLQAQNTAEEMLARADAAPLTLLGSAEPALPASAVMAAEPPPPVEVACAPADVPAAPPVSVPPPHFVTRRAARTDWEEDDSRQPDAATEAERYAIIYPQRARLIRRYGGLPRNCDFGPPEPYLVHAIAFGTSPALLALDQREAPL